MNRDPTFLIFPLGMAFVGFAVLGFMAFLQWKLTGSFIFAFIWFISLAVVMAFLYKAYRLYTLPDRLQKEREANEIMRRLRGVTTTTNWPGPQ